MHTYIQHDVYDCCSACPECRVTSDFVCPSMYWVDTKEEKEKLIEDYKGALARKDCKYFKQGRGKCPFGNKCFYLHALPDGTKRDVGPPPRQPRRQNLDHDGEIDVLQVGTSTSMSVWMFTDVTGTFLMNDNPFQHDYRIFNYSLSNCECAS